MQKSSVLYMGQHLLLCELKRIFRGVNYIAELDITDHCNLNCKHCYRAGKSSNAKELPLSVWRMRFESLYHSGIRVVALVGGEPSLRPDILLLADEMFPIVTVITNGIKKIPLEFTHPIFVSIDGTPATNDSIRGKGTFDRIMANYSGDGRVSINITLLRDNYQELEELIRLAQRHGFRGVVCNIYTPCLGTDDPMRLSLEERKNVIEELKRVKRLYPKMLDISWSSIKWYEDRDHRDACFWRENVLHFDHSWNRRKCYSDLADCSNCGCFSGTLGSPWKKIVKYPVERVKMLFR